MLHQNNTRGTKAAFQIHQDHGDTLEQVTRGLAETTVTFPKTPAESRGGHFSEARGVLTSTRHGGGRKESAPLQGSAASACRRLT